jgi:ketosteroid isomerase-like protein
MKKMLLFGVLAILAWTLPVAPAAAQIAWTKDQKALWNTELVMGNLAVKGDYAGVIAYMDDAFENWAPQSAIPVPKEVWAKGFVNYMTHSGTKYVDFHAIPLNIWVDGNYAYVNYYSTFIISDKDGKKRAERDRNMDVFRNKNDKWLLVASMTMDAPKNK